MIVCVLIEQKITQMTFLNKHDSIQGKLSGIRQESVNYVGYFSQHEETMKSVIQGQVR